MKLTPLARTALTGGIVAAALGCAAGAAMRPELTEIDTGRTLVVSQTPEYSDSVSYVSSWRSVAVDEFAQ